MALFNILGRDGVRTGQQESDVLHAQSVVTHLTSLLNARRGVLHHLADYGLPDVEDIYEGLPYSQHELALEVKKLIEKYEPRVSRVNVVPIDIKEDNCVIRFDITAYLSSGKTIRLNTRFASGGKANVSPVHKRDNGYQNRQQGF